MARAELPSGGFIEYRDHLLARDKFVVQDSVTLTFKDGGNETSMGIVNDQRNALLGRIITSWSYPVPIPSQNSFQAADVVIGEAMDLDDYNALSKAVQPLMDKLTERTTGDDPKKP
jgi:hypothetical protein